MSDANTYPPPSPDRKSVWAWCLYDWANSAFPTVVMTFVFATYFTKAVAETPEIGTTQWGWAMALSGVLIAVCSPVLGSAADRMGRRVHWVAILTWIMCLATLGLWWVTPDPSSVLLCLGLVVVANLCFELAIVFYNALLPSLVAPDHMGRISGWAWGVGYAGGLVCLVIVLFGLIQATPPPFGLDAEQAEPVRAAAVLVAVWAALFSLPLIAIVKDPPRADSAKGIVAAVSGAMHNMVTTIKSWPRERRIGRFLIARMLYTDGLNTLFAFGGIYAAGTFGLPLSEVIVFGIAMNVTAGVGAALFGWIDDRPGKFGGSKFVVLVSLVALITLGTALVLVQSVTWFWILGLTLGIFIGPVQAASRTFMARIAPTEDINTCFGLFALSGKITAFLGPAVLAMVTEAYASQRAGMATILVFLGIGTALLLTIPDHEVKHL